MEMLEMDVCEAEVDDPSSAGDLHRDSVIGTRSNAHLHPIRAQTRHDGIGLRELARITSKIPAIFAGGRASRANAPERRRITSL
jgi:hypothetical protein